MIFYAVEGEQARPCCLKLGGMVNGPGRYGKLTGQRQNMDRHDISDEKWAKIKDLLPGQRGQHGRVAVDNRLFLNAVLYIAKTGSPWRDLPKKFGLWNSVFCRFNKWCKKGRWQAIFDVLQDPDLEWLMLDSTVIRAHQHAAGMNTNGEDQDLGRSKGGFGTKIHAAFDALGNPVAFHLSPGQDADVTNAEAVIGDLTPEAIIGDKAYDSDELANKLKARGIDVVIPPKKIENNLVIMINSFIRKEIRQSVVLAC